MKSLLISIKPKWVVKILKGEKTIEVRKKFPKDYEGWVYIYCTKEEYLYKTNKGYHSSKKPLEVGKGTEYSYCYSDEGMVVARFYCDKVEEIYRSGSYLEYLGEEIDAFVTNELDNFKLLGCACLEEKEMGNYFESEYEACVGYAIHISNLEIFDKPKELSEFKHPKPSICGVKDDKGLYQCDKCKYGYSEFMSCECRLPLTKAPQSWCYIEVEE